MSELWQQVSPWIISAIGGFIGAAMLLPTKLGEIIFKYRFDKSIEAAKSDYARELENLKAVSAQELAKINERLAHIGDRAKRSNEREYDSITKVWEKFVDCFDRAEAAIVQYTEIPDLDSFSDDELTSFLSTQAFSKEQIDQVKGSGDKVRTFGQIVRWKYIAIAHNTIGETRNFLRKQIFVPPAIAEEIEKAIEQAARAIAVELTRFRHPSSELGAESAIKFFENRHAILARVKEVVQQRLMRSDSERG
ncbi:hypothetical protein ML401_02215 [Bradyrhizobium sp. 62B]|uniref:hypothetical protein n=1 Tax=Bradyrhizobium sp. 62B TaxID=2898442 RepID=UPI0025581A9E|nr:hypothetical protein ML401_02215 [Bradyrhizobium sp. 62B]